MRLGIHGSVLGEVVTRNGASGSYNSMHDSYQTHGRAGARRTCCRLCSEAWEPASTA